MFWQWESLHGSCKQLPGIKEPQMQKSKVLPDFQMLLGTWCMWTAVSRQKGEPISWTGGLRSAVSSGKISWYSSSRDSTKTTQIIWRVMVTPQTPLDHGQNLPLYDTLLSLPWQNASHKAPNRLKWWVKMKNQGLTDNKETWLPTHTTQNQMPCLREFSSILVGNPRSILFIHYVLSGNNFLFVFLPLKGENL